MPTLTLDQIRLAETEKGIIVTLLAYDNTTNEGMVNNSNQPSQTEKLNGMINKKITDLTEKLGKIGNEINELKKIEVTDEITKIVVGSTEFNIEDFMSEPDIHKYRNWLEVKKELEGKSEEDIDDLTGQSKSELWENGWVESVSYTHLTLPTTPYV